MRSLAIQGVAELRHGIPVPRRAHRANAGRIDGVSARPPPGNAIDAIIGLPAALPSAVRDVAVVGLTGLAIMIVWSFITNKAVKRIPAQLVVLLVCVPLSLALGLGQAFLVPMPNVLANPASAFAFPVFDRVATGTGIQFVVLFAVIGSPSLRAASIFAIASSIFFQFVGPAAFR